MTGLIAGGDVVDLASFAVGAAAGAVFVLLGFAAAWLWSLWQASVETDSDRLRLLVATAVGVSYGCVSLSPLLGYVYFAYLFVPARVAVVLATVWAIWGPPSDRTV